jgi:hypothetical protein
MVVRHSKMEKRNVNMSEDEEVFMGFKTYK